MSSILNSTLIDSSTTAVGTGGNFFTVAFQRVPTPYCQSHTHTHTHTHTHICGAEKTCHPVCWYSSPLSVYPCFPLSLSLSIHLSSLSSVFLERAVVSHTQTHRFCLISPILFTLIRLPSSISSLSHHSLTHSLSSSNVNGIPLVLCLSQSLGHSQRKYIPSLPGLLLSSSNGLIF